MTTYVDALESITATGKLIRQLKDEKEIEHLKDCMDRIFLSVMPPKPVKNKVSSKRSTYSFTTPTTSPGGPLTENEYAMLHEMVKNGKEYTNLDAVARAVTGDPNATHEFPLIVLRQFLRNHSQPGGQQYEIEIAQARSRKSMDQYRIKIGSMDKVKELISDQYYSNYPGYKNYSSMMTNQAAPVPVKVKVKVPSRTHAQLEKQIIAAVPFERKIKHVCDRVGRASSGSMYRLIKDIIVKHKLRLGSSL